MHLTCIYHSHSIYFVYTLKNIRGDKMNLNSARGALSEPPKINFLNLLFEAAVILAITFVLVAVAG